MLASVSWAAAIDTKIVPTHRQPGYHVIWTFLYISVSFSVDFYTFGVLIWRLSWAPGEYSTPFSAIHVWSRLFNDRVYCGYLLNLNQSRPILDLFKTNQINCLAFCSSYGTRCTIIATTHGNTYQVIYTVHGMHKLEKLGRSGNLLIKVSQVTSFLRTWWSTARHAAINSLQPYRYWY